MSEENLYVMKINKVKATWNKLKINRKFWKKKEWGCQDKDVSFNFY